MKIGIICHSKTGNTLSVAGKLQEALEKSGHDVMLSQVTAVNDQPGKDGRIELKDVPDATGYDALILAAPVWGFSLSPVMKAYLAQLPNLKGIKVSCFVTQQLPKAWLGGNRAIRQLSKAVEEKGVKVCETGIVNWSSKEREAQIGALVERLGKL